MTIFHYDDDDDDDGDGDGDGDGEQKSAVRRAEDKLMVSMVYGKDKDKGMVGITVGDFEAKSESTTEKGVQRCTSYPAREEAEKTRGIGREVSALML